MSDGTWSCTGIWYATGEPKWQWIPKKATMGPKHAIDVVAKAIVGNLYEHVEWEDYPEIGEADWEAVAQRVRELLTYEAAQRQYAEAFSVLNQRAKDWMAENGGDDGE